MSWIPVILLAAVTFLVAVFVLRLPKSGWMLFGAALFFGLAGYAWQGSPGHAGSPKDAEPVANEGSDAMIETRRDFFGSHKMPARFVVTADAFARDGQYQLAVDMLRNAVAENPRDAEAWLAMGNALVDHAEGNLTPAALYAFNRAEAINPENPAAAYFLGVAFIRSGKPVEAREVWADLLKSAPADAAWKEPIEMRFQKLDELIEKIGPAGPNAL